jgi:hypothetical protein
MCRHERVEILDRFWNRCNGWHGHRRCTGLYRADVDDVRILQRLTGGFMDWHTILAAAAGGVVGMMLVYLLVVLSFAGNSHM